MQHKACVLQTPHEYSHQPAHLLARIPDWELECLNTTGTLKSMFPGPRPATVDFAYTRWKANTRTKSSNRRITDHKKATSALEKGRAETSRRIRKLLASETFLLDLLHGIRNTRVKALDTSEEQLAHLDENIASLKTLIPGLSMSELPPIQ
jgi:hypothetical protein